MSSLEHTPYAGPATVRPARAREAPGLPWPLQPIAPTGDLPDINVWLALAVQDPEFTPVTVARPLDRLAADERRQRAERVGERAIGAHDDFNAILPGLGKRKEDDARRS